jgi:DNA-binding NarL/FixJ family response regulator
MYRVMIVDAHPIVRTGMTSILKGIPGVELWGTAGDWTEAIELAEKLRPNMAVVELALPQLDVIQLIPLMLKASPKTEILVLSIEASPSIVLRALRAGVRGYVSKAESVHDIIDAIAAIRNHQIFLSPQIRLVVDPTAPREQEKLTPRELEVLRLLAGGAASKQIGLSLGISRRTVDDHRSHVMHKLKLNGLSDLVRFAVQNDIVPL